MKKGVGATESAQCGSKATRCRHQVRPPAASTGAEALGSPGCGGPSWGSPELGGQLSSTDKPGLRSSPFHAWFLLLLGLLEAFFSELHPPEWRESDHVDKGLPVGFLWGMGRGLK